jgi:hypothetical protein
MKPFSFIGTVIVTLVLIFAGVQAPAVVITNEFWIDDNAFNGTNGGTLQDPFLATNQTQFDRVMTNLTARSNVIIHLLPGVYRTVSKVGTNPNEWYLKSGSRLLGSGRDVTIVKAQDSPQRGWTITSDNTAGYGIEVADLTIDANGSSAIDYGTGGLSLRGEKCSVRRVNVVNIRGTGSQNVEAFGIAIEAINSDGSPNYNGVGNLVEDCIVSSVLGDFTTAIAIAYGQADILNCKVYFTNEYGFAYNGGSFRNLRVIGNYSEGGASGFYSDYNGATNNHTFTNLLIANNIFKNCYQGITLNHEHRDIDTVSIFDNIIQLTSTEPPSVGKFGIVSWYEGRNFHIKGNVIRTTNALPTNTLIGSVLLWRTTGIIIHDNVFEATLRPVVTLDGYSFNHSIYNNYDLSGRFLTNYPQVMPPNGVTRRTITTAGTSNLSFADKYIGVQTTSAVTLNLPSAAGAAGKDFIIVGETTAPLVTVAATSSQTINGSAQQSITSSYGVLRIISDGANWYLW